MNWDEYRDFLLQYIPSAKSVSAGTMINCRCFECPDSSNINSAHMYISIPKDNEKPSMYYCHKCGCHGIVTHKKLIEWGIYDKDIALEIDKYNESVKLNTKSSRYFNDVIYKLNSTITTTNGNKAEFKRNYINSRIGQNLSFKDLRQLKIIVNLLDLITENHIDKLTRDERVVMQLDNEFVGFLSVDNAYLNMRRTCQEGIVYKEIDKRYVNYNLLPKNDTSQRFYTIPNKINLVRPDRIKLHIAEGPFDILSIYLNLRKKEEGIYTCVAGANYMNNILYYLIDMGLPYLEIHFYPDNDSQGTNERIKWIVNNIPDPYIPVYIHRNLYPGEKDFGVPINKIKETIISKEMI